MIHHPLFIAGVATVKEVGCFSSSARISMKGGYSNRARGRKFPFAIVALVFTTVLLYMWEKNPFLSTLRSAQYQFVLPSSGLPSEFISEISHDSSVSINLKKHGHQEVVESIARSSKRRSPQHEESSPKQKDCNLSKGGWVNDSSRPLYSGFGCKQWLSEMWACRLTQRTDFSYEAYRWQPENCEMPEFNRLEFLKRMQDKTIAFVGDSLGRQQFQSLMCMVSGGEDNLNVEDVGGEYGLVISPGHLRPDGWAFRFRSTNTTILYYWSASLCDLEPVNNSNPSADIAMHLDRPPAFMRRFLGNFDVLVLNTGHHWNRGKLNSNKWVMYVNGKPNVDKNLASIGNAKNFTVHSVVRWLDSQLPAHPRLKAFFRTISPRHFFNGDWNTGGSCDNTSPMSKGMSISQDRSSDVVVDSAVQGTKVKILDITALSELRDEGHISRFSIKSSKGIQDCLHWCLPGIPDTWNEILCAQI